MGDQRDGWIKWLKALHQSENSRDLSEVSRVFLDQFEQQLTDFRRQSVGDRTIVVRGFTTALKKTLRGNGISVDESDPSVVSKCGARKIADLGFHHRGLQWIAEIKTNLDFNSLGAATLEALLFRKKIPNCRFVLISLYLKDKASKHAMAILDECGLGDAFDGVFVLTDNSVDDDQWCADFVRRVNAMWDSFLVHA